METTQGVCGTKNPLFKMMDRVEADTTIHIEIMVGLVDTDKSVSGRILDRVVVVKRIGLSSGTTKESKRAISQTRMTILAKMRVCKLHQHHQQNIVNLVESLDMGHI